MTILNNQGPNGLNRSQFHLVLKYKIICLLKSTMRGDSIKSFSTAIISDKTTRSPINTSGSCVVQTKEHDYNT